MECVATGDRFASVFSSPGYLKKFFPGSPFIENGTATGIGNALE